MRKMVSKRNLGKKGKRRKRPRALRSFRLSEDERNGVTVMGLCFALSSSRMGRKELRLLEREAVKWVEEVRRKLKKGRASGKKTR